MHSFSMQALVDLHTFFKWMVNKPTKFGFDAKKVGWNCLRGIYEPPSDGRIEQCPDPERYIYFDEVSDHRHIKSVNIGSGQFHPTSKAHTQASQLARGAMSGGSLRFQHSTDFVEV